VIEGSAWFGDLIGFFGPSYDRRSENAVLVAKASSRDHNDH
jgi:hypothetical protein